MAWRLRKTKILGKGVRLTLNKTGPSISLGPKGFHVGAGPKGVYTSAGIPGTGLYKINYAKKTKGKSNTKDTSNTEEEYSGCLRTFLFLITLALTPFIIWLFIAYPITCSVICLSILILYIIEQSLPEHKAAKKLKEGIDLIEREKYDAGIKLLKSVQNLDPNNDEVLVYLGAAYHNYEKFSEAIPPLEKIRSKYPEFHDANFILANSYFRTKNFDKTITLIQNLPDEYQNNLQVIQLLGMSFAQQQKFDLAIDVFKRAPLMKRKLNYELAELHYNLGVIYFESGENRNALKHLKKVYTYDINFREVQSLMKKCE